MKYLFIPFIFFTCFYAQAQHKRTGISAFFAAGTGEIVHFSKQMLGGGSINGKSLNNIGLNYFTETAKNLFL